MPKKLVNLEIREVSSVDRGAGKGVKVMLMKNHQGATNVNITTNTSVGSALSICKRAMENSATSQAKINALMKCAADVFFGGDMSAMLKFDRFGRPETTFGQLFLAPVDKSGKTPGKESDNLAQPAEDDDLSDDDFGKENVSKAIQLLMKAGMSFDQAAGEVARAEKERKFGVGY